MNNSRGGSVADGGEKDTRKQMEKLFGGTLPTDIENKLLEIEGVVGETKEEINALTADDETRLRELNESLEPFRKDNTELNLNDVRFNLFFFLC